jgi:DNA-binding CsgD family transcriptional regulator
MPAGEPTSTLVERGREATALSAVLDQAIAGRGSVAMIEAIAGAGKTALLDLARQLGLERGLRVLRARGAESDRDVPLALLRDLFGRPLADLPDAERAAVMVGAAAVMGGALGLDDPRPITNHRLHQAAYWIAADLAIGQPTAFLIDDLHWADHESVGALAAIGGRLDDLPLALVFTRRPETDRPPSSALAELSLLAAVRLYPAPLTPAGVAAVLQTYLGATPVDERTAALGFEATGGNPFLVVQLATALADAAAPLNPRELEDLTAGVSQALSTVLRMRVERLGPHAVALARAVVILGDDCRLAEACALAGVPRRAGLRASAALASAGVFARDRVTAFAHPLVRAAIDAGLLAAHRQELKERAVVVLLDAGADPRRVAKHILQTEPAADARAVAALRAAAAAASAAAAPARAGALLRRAIAELPGVRPPPELLDEVIAAELMAGDFEQVTRHIRARLTGETSPRHRADLIRWLGRVVMQTRGIPAAVELLDDELAVLEGDGRLLVEAEQAWMIMLHPPLAGRLAELMARYAHLTGDTPGQRAMLAMVAMAMSFTPGQSAAAVAPIVARAFAEGTLLADEQPQSSIYTLALYTILLSGQFELAHREMSRAERAARESGSVTDLALALTGRAMASLYLGRIGDAEADALAAIEAGAATPGTLHAITVGQSMGIVVEARVERGDVNGAMDVLAEHGFVGDLGSDPQARALLGRARAHLAAGRPAEALADAQRRHAIFGTYRDVLSHSAPIESLAHLALGDRAAALEAASGQLHRARVWGTPSSVAMALRVAGLARGGSEGVEMLREAVREVEPSPARLELARCHVVLGMLLRRNGQRRAALEHLRRGADLAQRLGARQLAEDARDELRVLGARPRRLAFSGADALTAAERRTAQLAAEGRTNREIAQQLYLSLKTVESQLANAYRKLGIRSRDRLPEALRSPGPAGERPRARG